jgi:carbamoyltransferase
MTAILGLSAWYHDAAAALLVDGQPVYAAQEERHSRIKHDAAWPQQAIDAALRQAGLDASALDYVAYYEKPLLRFERLLETYLGVAPAGYASFARSMPGWLRRKQFVARAIRKALPGFRGVLAFTEHHEAHAASAFFPSPFEEAAVLTLDGAGEWSTASHGLGRGPRLELTHAQRFPHSLGLLYSAFTYFTGFAVNADEYKVMGLAPFGEPRFVDTILRELIDLKDDGSLRMDLSYFDFCAGLTMTSRRFDALFGGPPRRPEDPITQREMDLAASIQKVTELVVLRAARHVHAVTGRPRALCLAGGVALNCVANGRVLRETPFEDLWIQPAAGDAGGALGAALFVWHQLLGRPRTPVSTPSHTSTLLGERFDDAAIESVLVASGCHYRRLDDESALCREVADALANGRVVGWFQDRMEYGPRALGARSILADPRHPEMQSRINRAVKFREGFRPFAPAVLLEHAAQLFEIEAHQTSPYMLLVAGLRAAQLQPVPPEQQALTGLERVRQVRSRLPAITHVDNSARLQTVAPGSGRFRLLLEAFHARTGCPALVNTSFNLAWEPIVRTPQEALETFMSCELDLLCLGSFLVDKREQALHAPLASGRTEHFLDGKLWSPCCRAELARGADAWTCGGCGHAFAEVDGVPCLYWPHEADVSIDAATERVKSFYEETPFPNYNDHDSVRSLVDRARRGLYGSRLEQAIPFGADVLEVGCGTGQLANFLGIGQRRVLGADMCLNSLGLGERFRKAQGLARVRFLQTNLYRNALRPEQWDVVVCNGVLPALPDPERGFQELVRLVRPGGYLVVGLYNRYGRLMTDFRRLLFKLSGGRFQWIDPVLRGRGLSDARRRAWFADQYRHPLEVKHTQGQVLGWCDEAGLEFVRGVPALRPEDDGLAGHLFAPQPRGGKLARALVQLGQIFAVGQKEGGFFVMIARKPGPALSGQRPAPAPAPHPGGEDEHAPARQPGRAELYVLGVALPALCLVLAAVAGRFSPRARLLLWGAGALLTLAYWLVPVLRRPVYAVWQTLFEPLGRLVSKLLLGLVFFGLVTPLGLLLRALGRDPLSQRARPDSYWQPHRPGADPARYLRQS